MDKNQLLDHLGYYGYSLVQPNGTKNPEGVLEALLKQDDARLLEGFPVVFANVLKEKNSLAWENKKWNPSEKFSKPVEKRLASLLALAFLLFQLFGLEKEYQDRAKKLLAKCRDSKAVLADLEKSFAASEEVPMGKTVLSVERLKNNFRQYVSQSASAAENDQTKHALELELLLSELFTPRQKELLRKRERGEALTKTEKEYFYRVVRKRLKALASDELHQMAKGLV